LAKQKRLVKRSKRRVASKRGSSAGIEFSIKVTGRFRITRHAVERFIARLIIAAAIIGFGGGFAPGEVPPVAPPAPSHHSLVPAPHRSPVSVARPFGQGPARDEPLGPNWV
jgi:hypothetical protein